MSGLIVRGKRVDHGRWLVRATTPDGTTVVALRSSLRGAIDGVFLKLENDVDLTEVEFDQIILEELTNE